MALSRRRPLWPVVLLPLVSACATVAPLAPDRLNRLRAESEIVAVHYLTRDFRVASGGAAALGMFFLVVPFADLAADLTMRHDGERMREEFRLEDPVLRVKQRFLSALATDLGFANIRAASQPIEPPEDHALVPARLSIDQLKTAFGSVTMLEFFTVHRGWVLGYHNWVFRYRMMYMAAARLVRLEDSRVLWEGFCRSWEDDPKAAPTMDELRADNGALLREKVRQAADDCADQLLRQLSTMMGSSLVFNNSVGQVRRIELYARISLVNSRPDLPPPSDPAAPREPLMEGNRLESE